ncbi:flagellar assembly protein H [Shewanella eurypsychrophilus]|uniref:Flagellar assembly protein FliH n=1 Tax=Shewanella eurypsychrophilus TaxID=2593656 RepID=A0ABX6V0D5_9GAMM|nr:MULTISPECIES: flagellar assembly protein FliH [Shewanella]QFU20484.1 flagellar assembly protein H [Shewanella sp. YLB-09]QFU20765.1 flagellar assembly protein H [Shewanella sp. YLB-09]QPG56061.1 flagellar assembly protein H [Shewanella eurypsychrophilus]
MKSTQNNFDPKWRLKGDLARRHRFSPLIPVNATENSAEPGWQDYQEAFDKGYDEGVVKGHQEGFESGAEEGRRSGHASGFNQGRIEGQLKGKEGIDEQFNNLLAPLGALKSLLEDGHLSQINEQQQLILDLVRRVAQQVIRCELTLQPQQILSLVEETVASLPDTRSEIKIHLEPTAVERLRELAADKIQNWTLVEDSSISPGGCRIVSDNSDADASVETRLNACMDQVEAKLYSSSPSKGNSVEQSQAEIEPCNA